MSAAGQRRGRVLVVGAGGLGCPALLALGPHVREVGIVDDDVVELSNLNRQILHRTVDVGRPKVESAADALRARFPSLAVSPIRARVTSDNAAALFAGWDVVIDGTDSIESKFLINDFCVASSVALVHSGCVRYSGQVMSIVQGSACYRCLFEAPPPPGAAPSCSEAGILGAFAGVIGALQAKEALAILDGAPALAGKILVVDGKAGTRREVRVKRRPGCEAHREEEVVAC
jgi:molybdopterin/thiamine biosynthesis adenylyltransferase